MTKLNIRYAGFTMGARLADSLIQQPQLMAITYHGSPVLLHALKGLALRMRACEQYGVVNINGIGYATKGE